MGEALASGFTGAQQLTGGKLWCCKQDQRKSREMLRPLTTNELVSDLSKGSSEGPAPTRAPGSPTLG